MTGKELREKMSRLEEKRDDHASRAAILLRDGPSSIHNYPVPAGKAPEAAQAHATLAGVYQAQISDIERYFLAGGA